MTKNLSFLFFFLFSAMAGISQTVDFPENNAIWKEAQITIAGPITRHLALCGDTLFNGGLYSQIVELQVNDSMQITSSSYVGALRQENGLVYYHSDFLPDDILLYDFSLEAGDEITLSFTFVNQQVTRKVDSTDEQLLAGKMRKVIYFENTMPSCPLPPEMWIEGIGSSYGLLGRAFDPCTVADAGGQLLCFQQEDEYLNLTLIECFLPALNNCSFINATENVLPKNALLHIYPNPTMDRLFIEIKNELINADFKFSVINSFGQIIETELKNNGDDFSMNVSDLPVGIYFIKIMDGENRQVGFGKFIKQ
ncbi:MAG: T9SS type A sorting domain-containing protein [Saprospiraceae bacterium]